MICRTIIIVPSVALAYIAFIELFEWVSTCYYCWVSLSLVMAAVWHDNPSPASASIWAGGGRDMKGGNWGCGADGGTPMTGCHRRLWLLGQITSASTTNARSLSTLRRQLCASQAEAKGEEGGIQRERKRESTRTTLKEYGLIKSSSNVES